MKPDDELKDFPHLKKLQGNNPFEAPEGYFDTLSTSIADKISTQSNHKPVAIFRLKPILISGVAMIAIITSVFVFNHLQNKSNLASNNSNPKIEVTCDELIASGYYEELDENLLAESIIQEPNPKSLDTEIENYIIDNTDESTLINSF
jgi:hypothetical protein